MSQQTLKTLNEMLRNSVRLYGDRTAFKVKKEGKFVPITYKEFYNRVEKFGTGLLKIGIEKFDHIGLVSDNRFEWIIADMAIIGLRAVDVPCSGDSSPHDIYFKLHHSDAKAAILEGEKQFSKFFSLAKDLPQIKNIILLDRIKMFSEKEDAPEWAIPIGFEEDGKVSKKLYNELCSLIKNNNKYIFLSKEAKDYLDKYLEKNTNKLLKETHSTETTDSVKNKLLRKTVIINKNFNETHHYKIYYFPRIIQIGEELLAKGDTQFDEISKSGQPDDLTTIIYTSGTTANPKGVMLTNSNFMHQIRVTPPTQEFGKEDRWLSVLPTWHIFERTGEYLVLSTGALTAYSKPYKQVLLPDLITIKPTVMISVPRIWESVYKGIMDNVEKEVRFRKLYLTGQLTSGKNIKEQKGF